MKRVKRQTFINLLILLLALLGLGIMLFPTISDRYNQWKMEQEIAQYNQVAEAEKADYSDLWAAAEDFNRRLAEGGIFSLGVTAEERAEVEQLLNPMGIGMMGYVDIPKINVHLPIYQGIEEKELQSGAGWWIGTSLPTGGPSTHCVITAHNGLVKAKMFTDLDQLELGDTFTLSILDRVLTYEVDQILVVTPSEIEPLQIVEGQDYVTLYTCTPTGVNTHRLLVRGHRIETPESGEEGQEQQGCRIPLWFLLAVLLILVILLWKRAQNRKAPYRGKRLQTGARRAEGKKRGFRLLRKKRPPPKGENKP